MKSLQPNRAQMLYLLLSLMNWAMFPSYAQVGISTDNSAAFSLPQNATPALFYSNNFETGGGPEWSRRKITTSPSGQKFLGRFGSETKSVSLLLKNLPTHVTVKLTFDLYVIGSWDGNGNVCCGPDTWSLRIKNGPTLVNHTFSNTGFDGNLQSWPTSGSNPAQTGAHETDFLGYGYYGGEASYRMSFTIPHDEASLQLIFSGLLPDPTPGKENESWGLDNVQVSLFDAACDRPSFSAPKRYGAGQTPRGIVAADFNGDGLDDLAITNNMSFNVTILLATRGGNFIAATGSPIFIGSSPYSIVSADFNNDGKADLAVGENRLGGNLHILLGKGDGRFSPTPPINISIFRNAASLATADFNRDGKIDLAVGHTDASDITILVGDGAGGFTIASKPPVPFDVSFCTVATGDFNGDPYPDVATVGNDTGRMSILLGNGNGTFRAAPNSPFKIGERPRGIAVADFNGDGRQDLAVTTTNTENTTGSDYLVIRLGKGDGSFNVQENISTAKETGPIFTSDFNRDGWADLLIINPSLLVRLGTGKLEPTAMFAAPTAYNIDRHPWSATIGDFNGDGQPDVATANSSTNDVTVLLNTCETYDLCLQDEENRGTLRINTKTGEYRFDSCQSDGFSLMGKGKINTFHCLSILTDQQLIATYNQCQQSGEAIILKSPRGPLIFISDRNTQNNSCHCDK